MRSAVQIKLYKFETKYKVAYHSPTADISMSGLGNARFPYGHCAANVSTWLSFSVLYLFILRSFCVQSLRGTLANWTLKVLAAGIVPFRYHIVDLYVCMYECMYLRMYVCAGWVWIDAWGIIIIFNGYLKYLTHYRITCACDIPNLALTQCLCQRSLYFSHIIKLIILLWKPLETWLKYDFVKSHCTTYISARSLTLLGENFKKLLPRI